MIDQSDPVSTVDTYTVLTISQQPRVRAHALDPSHSERMHPRAQSLIGAPARTAAYVTDSDSAKWVPRYGRSIILRVNHSAA